MGPFVSLQLFASFVCKIWSTAGTHSWLRFFYEQREGNWERSTRSCFADATVVSKRCPFHGEDAQARKKPSGAEAIGTYFSNLCGHTSFRLSQHEKFFVVYLGNEMSLSEYLSITDTFFLWGSQRKQLVYVDAIFVSVDVPMLYTLSLLTRVIPIKPMVVTQLPFSMNRWIPFFRTANGNVCLFYKWP